MYVLVKNGQIVQYPYSATDLIRANPNVSWPADPLSDAILAENGVLRVHGTPPTPNRGETVDEGAPAFIDGRWERRFTVRPCNAQETAQQAAQVRSTRNAKLKDSDWTQVADAPVDKTAYATYRQALRDITAQSGFPWEVTWPIQPE